jgi:transposase
MVFGFALYLLQQSNVKRAIARGRRALRHVLNQAALAAVCHNPILEPVAKRLKACGKPYELLILAIDS